MLPKTPTRIDLPGLIGTEPLAFLAAFGLVHNLLDGSLLSWDPDDSHAILHSDRHKTIPDVVATLVKRIRSIGNLEAVPHTHSFPIRRRPGQPDPLKIRPSEHDALVKQVSRGFGSSWIKAVLSHRATDADGFCQVNPLVGIRGQQTIGSFWYYPMREVRRDPERLITEALTGWRRVVGAEGWLLDHRATYSTDPRLRGPGGSNAVPGATWLATLAVPQFGYQLAQYPEVHPPGWFEVGNRLTFVWPLWTLPAHWNSMEAVFSVANSQYVQGWQVSPTRGDSLRIEIGATHGVSSPNQNAYSVDLEITSMHAAARLAANGPLTPVPVDTIRVPNDHGEWKPWKGWDWKPYSIEPE